MIPLFYGASHGLSHSQFTPRLSPGVEKADRESIPLRKTQAVSVRRNPMANASNSELWVFRTDLSLNDIYPARCTVLEVVSVILNFSSFYSSEREDIKKLKSY